MYEYLSQYARHTLCCDSIGSMIANAKLWMVNSQLAAFNFERKHHNLIVNNMFFFIKLFSKLLGSYKAYFSLTLFSAEKHDYRIFVSLFAH